MRFLALSVSSLALLAAGGSFVPAHGQTTRPAALSSVARSQLPPDQQALGWWMSGSGAVSMIAGGFALGAATVTDSGPTHDLQIGAGVALLGLGATFLATGVYLLSFDPPGPCETSGTALDGPASGPASGPSSRPSSRPAVSMRLSLGPTGALLHGRF